MDGSEIIILGGVGPIRASGPLLHETGAASDPATDRWRQLPRGRSQPGLNNLLFARYVIAWDGKFYFAYEIETGALLDIEYQGPDLVLSDKAFVTPNASQPPASETRPLNPEPELWFTTMH